MKTNKNSQSKDTRQTASDIIQLVAGSNVSQAHLQDELALARVRFYALQEFSNKVFEFKVSETRARAKLRK